MIRPLLVAFFAVILAGCASNVVTDYDSGTVFGNYSSWDFLPANTENQDYVSLDGSRIRNAIEREMNRKAMRKAPAEEADLLVAWQIATEERLERQGGSFGFGFGFGFGSRFGVGLSAPPPIEKIQEGKLVVELVDAETRQVVWRSASRRLLNEDQSRESRRELIDQIVSDMFADYPPGTGG